MTALWSFPSIASELSARAQGVYAACASPEITMTDSPSNPPANVTAGQGTARPQPKAPFASAHGDTHQVVADSPPTTPKPAAPQRVPGSQPAGTLASHDPDGANRQLALETQEFFLPVHGYVRLTQHEVEVINHPAFQRLRRTRQLGFAHLIFPGGTHTRFEHSIGAVHIAARIISHVNQNSHRSGTDHPRWTLGAIPEAQQELIRLAALLHDIGHIPFGHTLEDELGHLPPHDDDARLTKVSKRIYSGYRPSKLATGGTPESDSIEWTLEKLIDTLYKVTVADRLGITGETPFSVVQAIISKEPKKSGDDNKRKKWQEQQRALEEKVNLSLCRDVVGNTICADFLDYLYRDWYHLGKPLYEDKRIYQYMEARLDEREERPQPEPDDRSSPTGLEFVINIGSGEKIRHDALTSILELLEARYELAETVLFHRAKLSITALLDRCLLEIGHLYQLAGVRRDLLHKGLEDLLLEGSDDTLSDVLKALSAGSSDKQVAKLLSKAIASSRSSAASATGGDLLTEGPTPTVPMEELQDSIRSLVERLRNRSIYRMLYKLKFSDIQKSHRSGESGASKVVDLYADVDKRRAFLHGLEMLCNLPACSLVMYCPPTKMNAKVADVKLLIEDDVVTFAEYDQDDSQSNLTRGALSSRTQRFAELWSAQVFLRHDVWAMLDDAVCGTRSTPLTHLRHVIRQFLFQSGPRGELDVTRMNIQPSIDRVRGVRTLEAARSATTNYDLDRFDAFEFPSGLPFLNPTER